MGQNVGVAILGFTYHCDYCGILNKNQNKISLFSKKLSSLTDTQNENEDTMVAAVMNIQHIQLILEEEGPCGPDGRRPS